MMRNIIQVWLVCMAACICDGHARVPEKIVGGYRAENDEFPHAVSLHSKDDHFCGGCILNGYHILTAASCVVLDIGVYQSNIRVLSGSNDLLSSLQNGNVNEVSHIFVHEGYDPEHFWIHDIAILRLSTPIETCLAFPEIFQSISPPDRWYGSADTLYISGWGAVDKPNGIPVRFLQKVTGKILSTEACEHYYERTQMLHVTQRCVKPSRIDKDTAISKGDGGSPLTLEDKVIGIISVSEPFINAPAVFTSIFYYRNWIEQIIELI